MPGDIRSFFGGGPPKPAAAKAAAPAKKKVVDDGEAMLLDSDDEGAGRPHMNANADSKPANRKRLKSKSAKAVAAEPSENDPSSGGATAAGTGSGTSSAHAISVDNAGDENNDESATKKQRIGSSSNSSKGASPSPKKRTASPSKAKAKAASPKAEAAPVDNSLLLPALKKPGSSSSSSSSSSVSQGKEVEGGVAAFFGEAPIAVAVKKEKEESCKKPVPPRPAYPAAGTMQSSSSSSVKVKVEVEAVPGKDAAAATKASLTRPALVSMQKQAVVRPEFVPLPRREQSATCTGGGGAGSGSSSSSSGGGGASPHKTETSTQTQQPVGKQAIGCFEDVRFVVSGSFAESGTGRDGIEKLILENGGKIAATVTGRTHFLVLGPTLEDGRPGEDGNKYKAAMEVSTAPRGKKEKTPVITEEQLREKIAAAAAAAAASASTRATPAVVPAVKKEEGAPVPPQAAQELLWVDKYKPGSCEDIIGADTTYRNFLNWLMNWEGRHLTKTLKLPPFSKENPGAKAVLLSGPPGIGKTTLATLVSKQMGYETLELNASDTRSKKAVSEELADVVLSRSIAADGSMKKRLVIMDEVDGMGAGDRGGMPELMKVIKASKSPIVCICNDRMHTKIRSLVGHCYDLRVQRPNKRAIAQRLMKIGINEGLTMEANAAEMLVEQSGNDIRQAIHAMQMWRAQSTTMRYTDLVGGGLDRIEKDKVLRLSPFDSCLSILAGTRTTSTGAHGSLNDRYNAFFVDYSLVPLLVQQNYIESARSGIFQSKVPAVMGLSAEDKMDRLAEAADAVSDMELAGARLMGADQHWELLPTQAMMAIRVGHLTSGYQSFPTFPQWLGKFSTQNKSRRLTNELVAHTQLQIGQGFGAMRLDYAHFLRERLLTTVLDKTVEQGTAVKKTVDFLDSYGLSKDDFTDNLKDLGFAGKDKNKGNTALMQRFPDRYEAMDTKLKTALTRLYNSTEHRSQALAQSVTGGKKRAGGGGASNNDNTAGVLGDEEEEEEEDEDDKRKAEAADTAAFIKAAMAKKKAAKKPAAKKAAAPKKK